MFNPPVGSIVMALAVLACLGSLLWAGSSRSPRPGRRRADERMFPAFFSKVNGMGAPVIGHDRAGRRPVPLALSTISPNLSEQFGVLVNLAVVTNVVPYIIALSALIRDDEGGRTSRRAVFTAQRAIALVAMLYSTYAIYASGKNAVMGGMIVMGIGYIIWGFIAPRFIAKPAAAQPSRVA